MSRRGKRVKGVDHSVGVIPTKRFNIAAANADYACWHGNVVNN